MSNRRKSPNPHKGTGLGTRPNRHRLFSAAVQSSIDAIITKTLDGVITGWNPAAERLFGFSIEEAIGESIDIIVPSAGRAELRDIMARIKRGELVEHHDTVRQAKNGKLVDVSLSVSPIRSPSGIIIGVCTIARDIAEQRLTEEKFRLAVEASPSGMVMADCVGHIVMVNAETERLFGYGHGELLGQTVDSLIPERLRARHFQHRFDYAGKPESRRMGANRDLFGRRKDGTEFPVEVGLKPIQTRNELLILGVIVDITERERIDRLKDEFVSTVSHELRTPLTSISGSLGLLMGNAAGKLPDRARHLLSLAQSNSQRLVRLVNDILDIEKLESSRVIFNLQAVDVGPLLAQTIEANLGFAETYRVSIRRDGTADAEVRADPDRLSQVFTNLISNAIKFSPPGGEVVVAGERRGGRLRISVRDHGAGIPAEFKSRVFEKFAQADGSNTKRSGSTGLGLSIVKQIVARLDGEVGFSDAPGGGTIFYVDLPCWDRSERLPLAAGAVEPTVAALQGPASL